LKKYKWKQVEEKIMAFIMHAWLTGTGYRNRCNQIKHIHIPLLSKRCMHL